MDTTHELPISDAASDTAAATVALAGLDEWIVQGAMTILAIAAAALTVAVLRAWPDIAADQQQSGRWLASYAPKRWTELYFIYCSPIWIAILAIVIATKAYETFTPAHYFWVCTAVLVPPALSPWVCPAFAEEAGVPWHRRFAVKSHVWLGILVYVGSYFWTHYFESLLGAYYTFEAWRINNVPIAMFFAAHAYFCLYHSLTNMALRRWYTSATHRHLSPLYRRIGTCVLVAVMSWVTAFMEAFTIQGFPYYHIESRQFMYTIGGIVYGLYFVVSFPMYYRLDEPVEHETATSDIAKCEPQQAVPLSNSAPKRGRSPRRASLTKSTLASDGALQSGGVSAPFTQPVWTLSQTCIDSLGASMLVTILLDLWRITYLGLKAAPGDAPLPGLAWTNAAH